MTITPDQLLAVANLGLALVFYPMLIRNQIRGYCHLPLMTSVPKVGLLTVALSGFWLAGLPLAAFMCGVDTLCWVLLVVQRKMLGDTPRRKSYARLD